MKLEIRNNNGDVHPIPKYKFDEGSLDRRVGITERFGKDGGFAAGDRKWKGRTTSLTHTISGKDDAEFNEELIKLVKILDDRFNPYFIVDTKSNRRMEFELLKFDLTGRPGLERHRDIRLRIFLPEVAWEDLTETIETSPSSGTASGESVEVNNTGQIETYPVIIIAPTAKNSDFTLFNDSIEDLITIGSNAFTVGTTIEIDAINGTVFLDDGTTRIEISSSVADGTGFFVLARGINVISYESPFGNVDIQIIFRNRFLF